MGLAASQARLLTITSRKADCEFLSMNLSHQKLALARNMEVISDEYQNALNTTKLVYDYYGCGTSDMPLTYGLLMTPSVYNDYYPKFVTDSTNRIVLNSAYAAAAREAGIPTEGFSGLPSSDVRNRFIEALCGNNIISPTTASTVESTTYNQQVGLGAPSIEAEVPTTNISYSELLSLLNVNDITKMDDYTSYGGLYNIVTATEVGVGHRGTIIQRGSGRIGGKYSYEDNTIPFLGITTTEDADVDFENSPNRADAVSGLRLTDLLYDAEGGGYNYSVGAMSEDGEELPISEMAWLQTQLTASGGFLDWLYDAFDSVLGGTVSSDMALQQAYQAVFDLICPSENELISYYNDVSSGIGRVERGDRLDWFDDNYGTAYDKMTAAGVHTKQSYSNRRYHTDWTNMTNNYLGFTFSAEASKQFDWFGFNGGGEGVQTTDSWTSTFHQDRYDRTQCSISLSNLAKAFLTEYIAAMNGTTAGLSYTYGTGGLYRGAGDTTFEIVTDVVVDDSSTDLEANYYDTMFNLICTSGWVENDRVDDKEYLAQMFKNGMMFISSINADGYYSQASYSTERAILEVPDTDAIARAEAKYNTEKAKIENKENSIDMKMKNLDTEISSLSTEYDTVKSLISKTIERSIKRYEA